MTDMTHPTARLRDVVPGPDLIDLVVVGAHMSHMALNHELTTLDAHLDRVTTTAPDYRLFALPNTVPAKPGLLNVGPGRGHRIEVEVWRMAPAAFGWFVANIPAPLGIGSITLGDGAISKGFLVEEIATRGARDVSAFGGWRAYIAGLSVSG
jgi:allophanate hydrolase